MGIMGNLYAWASPEYMLYKMSWEEIMGYIDVFYPQKKKKNNEPPDRDAFKKAYPNSYRSK